MYGGSYKNKINGGVNKIIRSGELGEVQSSSFKLNLPASASVSYKNDSEGEVDKIDKLSSNGKTKKSSDKHKIINKSKKNESKLIELTVSSKQPKTKNNIKIESIRKF